MNAVFLTACHVSGNPALMEAEDILLRKTREWVTRSLAESDRLYHSLQASVLLSGKIFE